MSGNIANTGCPVADKNVVTLHTVNIGGSSTKVLLSGASARVFDRNSPEFQIVAGGKNPDGSLYGVIYEADSGRVGACTTDSTGICYAGEASTGDYLVVVKYYDSVTRKSIYVGLPKGPRDFVDSNGDNVVDLATKEFQIMKVYKKGIFQEYRGGSKIVVTGSLLEIITPDSAVWEGSRSIYPFIFTSDSEWNVDVCAQVPSGYNVIGIYDENGDLVSGTECVQAFVSGETKVVAFEVVETGSPEPSLSATIKVKGPNGKSVTKKVVASDIRKKTFNEKLGAAKAKSVKGITGNVVLVDTGTYNAMLIFNVLTLIGIVMLLMQNNKRRKIGPHYPH